MFELVLAGAAAYGAYRLCRSACRHAQAAAQSRRWAREAAAQRQRQRMAEEAARQRAAEKVSHSARLMQIALIQLPQSPDFRRAATFARHAKSVPVAFRRRQFQRFRPLLVEHLAARLRDGMTVEQLLPGLTDLVTALGIAGYEADYICLEAEGQLQQRAGQPPLGFAAQMRQLQAEHQQRLDAIQCLPDLAPELREQLVEAEQQRFRERMIALGNAEGEETTT
jgi:hypothetical protein